MDANVHLENGGIRKETNEDSFHLMSSLRSIPSTSFLRLPSDESENSIYANHVPLHPSEMASTRFWNSNLNEPLDSPLMHDDTYFAPPSHVNALSASSISPHMTYGGMHPQAWASENSHLTTSMDRAPSQMPATHVDLMVHTPRNSSGYSPDPTEDTGSKIRSFLEMTTMSVSREDPRRIVSDGSSSVLHRIRNMQDVSQPPLNSSSTSLVSAALKSSSYTDAWGKSPQIPVDESASGTYLARQQQSVLGGPTIYKLESPVTSVRNDVMTYLDQRAKVGEHRSLEGTEGQSTALANNELNPNAPFHGHYDPENIPQFGERPHIAEIRSPPDPPMDRPYYQEADNLGHLVYRNKDESMEDFEERVDTSEPAFRRAPVPNATPHCSKYPPTTQQDMHRHSRELDAQYHTVSATWDSETRTRSSLLKASSGTNWHNKSSALKTKRNGARRMVAKAITIVTQPEEDDDNDDNDEEGGEEEEEEEEGIMNDSKEADDTYNSVESSRKTTPTDRSPDADLYAEESQQPMRTRHPCPYCTKTFSRPRDASRHINEIHRGNNRTLSTTKDHVCGVCGKEFGRKQNLTRHLDGQISRKTGRGSGCDKHIAGILREQRRKEMTVAEQLVQFRGEPDRFVNNS